MVRALLARVRLAGEGTREPAAGVGSGAVHACIIHGASATRFDHCGAILVILFPNVGGGIDWRRFPLYVKTWRLELPLVSEGFFRVPTHVASGKFGRASGFGPSPERPRPALPHTYLPHTVAPAPQGSTARALHPPAPAPGTAAGRASPQQGHKKLNLFARRGLHGRPRREAPEQLSGPV